MRKMGAIFATWAAFLCLASGHLHAQNWPSKSVRIVAPFAPGGAADTLGRIVAEPLSSAFKQQFFVENRAGAGGMIGAAAVAQAAPDGYTFVVSGVASHVIAPAMSPNPGFDPVRDFTHIAYLGGPPVVLIVNPSHPAKDLQGVPRLGQGEPETARLYFPRHRNAGQSLRRGPRTPGRLQAHPHSATRVPGPR